MESSSNDWDLQAVVRSCGTRKQRLAPSRRRSCFSGSHHLRQVVDYLDLDHELAPPFSITPAASADDRRPAHGHLQTLFSLLPAASTSSGQSISWKRAAGRKPAGVRAPRPKTSKKSQLKKVVREVPAADGGVSTTDLWAWRKYGQKPIKGSPYPRGYYKCSSLKACVARKLVERSPEKPGVAVVTYIGEHCHAVPTMLNSLAGTTRESSSPDDRSRQSDEASSMTMMMTTVDGGAETPDEEEENVLLCWPVLEETAARLDE